MSGARVDPQVQGVLDDLAARATRAPWAMTVQENRDQLPAFTTLAGERVPVGSVRDATVPTAHGPVPVRVTTPTTADGGPLPVTVFLHGGGWVLGDLDSQDHIARVVTERARTVVVSVDYRLAPEHPFPAALDDARAVVEWVAAHAAELGGDPERIAVLGESAGGTLAAVVAQELHRAGGPTLVLQALVYPVTDRFDDSPSMRTYATGPVLSVAQMEWFWGAYLASPDQGTDPRVSPMRAPDLSGVAPAVVVTAELDPLRDQGVRYVAALRAAGVPVQHRAVAGVPHAFLSFTRDSAVARSVLDEVADTLAAAFRPGLDAA